MNKVDKSRKRTKIVATLGPATSEPEKIRELLEAGVNVIRLNMKHNEISWHEEMIERVQKEADNLELAVGIMIDLQGPEIRVGTFNGQDISFEKGDVLTLSSNIPTDINTLSLGNEAALNSLEKGDVILFEDGAISFTVTEKIDGGCRVKADDDYTLKNMKSANIPEKFIDTPSLVEKDLSNLEVATRKKVDYVALSFVRNSKDVKILKKELQKRRIKARVIAKIENRPALDNIEKIVRTSDGIMIARGDLGVEVPIRELAYWQKKIIDICRDASKPVIVATQMLKSMTQNPRPTRAEATDIANAVFDGTDALMLSEETAIGKYPVKAVKQMASIARFSERQDMVTLADMNIEDGTEVIVEAVFNILNRSKHVDIDAIIVFTESGYTARAMSAHRPDVPMIAITNNEKTRDYLTLTYGVETYVVKFPKGQFDFSKLPIDVLFKKKLLKKGSVVLATHGRHWGEPGATSVLGLFKV